MPNQKRCFKTRRISYTDEFLSSIGHVMAGSAIKEILSLIYAENSVLHMLSGKAYTKAVRGFLLLERAKNALIHENTIFKNDSIEVC